MKQQTSFSSQQHPPFLLTDGDETMEENTPLIRLLKTNKIWNSVKTLRTQTSIQYNLSNEFHVDTILIIIAYLNHDLLCTVS